MSLICEIAYQALKVETVVRLVSFIPDLATALYEGHSPVAEIPLIV